MLDIKLLRTNPDAVRQGLKARGGRYLPALEELLTADVEWRKLNAAADELRARKNKAGEDVGRLKREKKDASAVLKEMEGVKTELKELEDRANALEAKLRDGLLNIPNLPDASVALGKDPSENKTVREWGSKPSFAFSPKDHQELGEALGILDFARAAKLSGARFALSVGEGARLERALVQFMLDLHREHGYLEVFPPFLVTRTTMTGTGQLPKFEEELYGTKEDDLFLIPTAEVPVTNLYRDEVLDEASLPRALCAYTACFRREAGTYGKDTRGLIRNHQFNKVELVRFCRPEDSLKELEVLTGHAEEVLKRLELPYRVLALCTGDLGFSSAKTYDLEVWMSGDRRTGADGKPAAPGAYREISSCSTFTDYQSRRIGIQMKRKDGGRALPHTLNGSGVAVGRTVAALLENGQQADGSVLLPKALQPYMGTDRLTKGKSL